MSDPTHAALVAREREILRNLNACTESDEMPQPGATAFWMAEHRKASEARMRVCPSCGSAMPRALGAKGYQCHACTQRDESAF